MATAEPSRTAMITAVCRGRHRDLDADPHVLDDRFALDLVGSAWTSIDETLGAALPEPARSQMRAGMVARSRYVEDRAVDGGFTQYVLIGAGLESFAWRRPDLLDGLRVIEIDHPATQSWKRTRASTVGLTEHPNHRFVPLDLEQESLDTGLERASIDRSVPTCFAWLGVTQYLGTDAITATLEAVARCAPGSEVVFTYVLTEPHLDDIGALCLERNRAIAAATGEDWQTLLAPDHAAALAERSGLAVRENLTRDDMHDRYFTGRSDDLTPYTLQGYLAAGR